MSGGVGAWVGLYEPQGGEARRISSGSIGGGSGGRGGWAFASEWGGGGGGGGGGGSGGGGAPCLVGGSVPGMGTSDDRWSGGWPVVDPSEGLAEPIDRRRVRLAGPSLRAA